MFNITRVVLIILILFVISPVNIVASPLNIKVGGTGSSIGFMKLLAQKYKTQQQNVIFEVLPSLGSSGGMKALQSGAIDVAITSRPLKEKEKKGVKAYTLGQSPFMFAVHPSVSVDSLTQSQLIEIYLGKTNKWPNGVPIRRVLRPGNDTDWLTMKAMSSALSHAMDIAHQTEGLFIAVTDNDAVDYLERVEGSISPTTLTLVLAEKRRVKILSFEGTSAVDNSSQSIYPFQKTYFLAVRNELSSAVADFLNFIFSEQGKEVLVKAGVKPNKGLQNAL